MNLTEKAIIEAYWGLLYEKPYNKITVNDIANACNINRNTFYYHFHDIPQLLELTVKSRTDYFIENYSKFGSPMECIVPIVKYCVEKKPPILNIYKSVERETFLKELERFIIYMVKEYVDTAMLEINKTKEEKEVLIKFSKCVILGVMVDWLDNEMNYDLPEYIHETSVLIRSLVDEKILPFGK